MLQKMTGSRHCTGMCGGSAPREQSFEHLVSLVVESDPGDSGVAWTSEADDLLGVTPLKHSHAAILSSCQV